MPHVQIGAIIWNLIQFYNFLIIFWCLLSWFPAVRWYEQPWKTLDAVVQPIITPFRKILPPINGIDLSPMIATAVLYFVGGLIRDQLMF